MRRADPRAGFTLIEVLAALVITTAFVAVVLPYAGRLVTHWWVGETAVEVADGWMQAISRMSGDLAEAVPFGLGPDDHPVVAFRAGPESIEFVRPGLRTRELEAVTYEIRPTAAGSALIRRSRGFDPADFGVDAGAAGATTALIDGPYRFRMVMIGRDGARQRGWSAPDQMPAAVELSAIATGRGTVPVAPMLMPITALRTAVAPKLRGNGSP